MEGESIGGRQRMRRRGMGKVTQSPVPFLTPSEELEGKRGMEGGREGK